jgi:hypothetical protein
VVFLNPSRRTLGWYLKLKKLDHDHFLPKPFQFIIIHLSDKSLVWDFIARGVFQGKVAGLQPNSQPRGPVPRIYTLLGTGSPVRPQALGSSGSSGMPLPVPTDVRLDGSI